MKIVFFGTSSFSVTILQHLLATPYQLIGVVTRPDKPQGRSLKLIPSPVKEWLQTNHPHIPLYQPHKASSSEFVALLQTFDPDLFVVASYGEIMKTPLLNVPKKGPINVHASLLPHWRGAAPIQRCLMAGDAETGVTIMKMVLELDAGDMLDIAKVPIPLDMNHEELQSALALASKEPLLRVLARYDKGAVNGTPQDPSQATFAPKITPADLVVDWSQPALTIHNQIRALAPQPGAWTPVQIGEEIKKLKIKKSSSREHTPTIPKKTHLISQKEWIIQCGKDLLILHDVQLEGKKTLPIGDFLRGLHHPPKIC